MNWVEEQELAFKEYETYFKYRTNEQIEYKAIRLLKNYNRDLICKPQPFKVEDFFYDFLYDSYNLDFVTADLSNDQFVIAGGYDIYKNKISIDKRIYNYGTIPEKRRYYFTFGHELSHAILHGRLIRAKLNQEDFFGTKRNLKLITINNIIEHPEKEQIFYMDRQANYFTGACFMPKDAVEKVFIDFGYKEPIVYDSNSGLETYQFAKEFGRQFNDIFDVNPAAMGCRLIKLGLIVDKTKMKGN